ncbi:unnamed protein product [Caretta caretta]
MRIALDEQSHLWTLALWVPRNFPRWSSACYGPSRTRQEDAHQNRTQEHHWNATVDQLAHKAETRPLETDISFSTLSGSGIPWVWRGNPSRLQQQQQPQIKYTEVPLSAYSQCKAKLKIQNSFPLPP